ncbi:MAG: YhbD family protein [Oscillospiraceae bacterium]|nr:YhbD family protein [Oscillospiraceae bacterium]
MDLISKKELLALTGISYGQLYRWKRQGLIPEEWFIKRSAYTGQETFFPREQILSRIRTIQEAKDDFSLEELSKLLNPQAVVSGFCSAEKLEEMPEISPETLSAIRSVCPKDCYEFNEVVAFAVCSRILGEQTALTERSADLLTMALGVAKGFGKLGNLADATLTLFQMGEGELHLLLRKTATPLVLDQSMEQLGDWDLGPFAGAINLKYQTRRNRA